ncbi:amidohydrolase family protein [Plastorhodobacter daqingensis]|uniref:Amidohydrolase family protein n=1 Tax=Plastorhodobacter daqingensis TaxID=1387281 RepID=A0ABW2UL17_9RHOB
MKTGLTRRDFIQTTVAGGVGLCAGSAVTYFSVVPPANARDQVNAITNARIFDGTTVIDARSVLIADGKIALVGGELPSGVPVLDAHGATLAPGLIDSHVHTDSDGLKTALKFGVTTELDMNGQWSGRARRSVAADDSLADIRAPGAGLTPPGGHPTEYQAESKNLLIRYYPYPTVSTPEEATAAVAKRVAQGADYIKIFLEDGEVVGHPGLPMMDDATLRAAVDATHRYGKLAIAHAVTLETATRAVSAGVDGLAHLFVDRPHTPDFIEAMAASGAFVIPCLVLNSSAIGINAADLAADPRVNPKLDKSWLDALGRSFNTFPEGRLEVMYASIRALREAGIDILAGTDVSEPLPGFGGLAHGASLHDELRHLVAAGLSPSEALQAATATPARRFSLADRGRIAPGLRADLVLMRGDPLSNIGDTLSVEAVWRRGARLATLT